MQSAAKLAAQPRQEMKDEDRNQFESSSRDL